MNELRVFLESLDCPGEVYISEPCKEPKPITITIVGTEEQIAKIWKKDHSGEKISLSLECTDYDEKGNIEAMIV